MEDVVRIRDFLFLIQKRWLLITLLTLLAVALSGFFTFFVMKPVYQSSTLLLVKRSLEADRLGLSEELYTNEELINTYNVIITSPRILEQVIERLSLNDSHKTLRKRVEVSSEGESQVVSIRAADRDPVVAMNIANTIAAVFQKEIVEIMDVNNVSILSEAERETAPISPIPLFNMTIAALSGLLFSFALALLLENLDTTIRSEADIEEIPGLVVLGAVAELNGKEKKRLQEIKRRGMPSGQ